MEDITKAMLSFKEAMRHLWNGGFVANLQTVDCDDVADFQDISRFLFIALVLRRRDIDVEFNRYGSCCRDIIVAPNPLLNKMPVLVDIGREGRWQNKTIPVKEFGAAKFIEFFDWQGFSQADFPYVRCWSELQSCEYLVEQQDCKFFSSSISVATTSEPK